MVLKLNPDHVTLWQLPLYYKVEATLFSMTYKKTLMSCYLSKLIRPTTPSHTHPSNVKRLVVSDSDYAAANLYPFVHVIPSIRNTLDSLSSLVNSDSNLKILSKALLLQEDFFHLHPPPCPAPSGWGNDTSSVLTLWVASSLNLLHYVDFFFHVCFLIG